MFIILTARISLLFSHTSLFRLIYYAIKINFLSFLCSTPKSIKILQQAWNCLPLEILAYFIISITTTSSPIVSSRKKEIKISAHYYRNDVYSCWFSSSVTTYNNCDSDLSNDCLFLTTLVILPISYDSNSIN